MINKNITVSEMASWMKQNKVSCTELAKRSGLSYQIFSHYKRKAMKSPNTVVSAGVHEVIFPMMYPHAKMEQMENKQIPVYDVSVLAGVDNNIIADFSQLAVVKYITASIFNDCYLFLIAKGDSVEPRYEAGSYIPLRKINKNIIMSGYSYFFFFDGENPYPPMLRLVRKSTSDDKIILSAYNPKYEDVEIDKSSIAQLFIVRGNISESI